MRYSILNAYFVDAKTQQLLHPEISPVNSFRIIFNSYFNTKFKLLADESYYSHPEKPYNFNKINKNILQRKFTKNDIKSLRKKILLDKSSQNKKTITK